MQSFLDIPYGSDSSLNLAQKLPIGNIKANWPQGPQSKLTLELSSEDKIVEEELPEKKKKQTKIFDRSVSPRRKKYTLIKRKKENLTLQRAYTRQSVRVVQILSKITSKTSDTTKKFVEYFQKHKLYNNHNNLNELHHNIIHDAAHFYESKIIHDSQHPWKGRLNFMMENNIWFMQLLLKSHEWFLNFMQRVPLFNPNSPLKIVFDLLLLFFVLVQLFIFSIEVGFIIDLTFESVGAILTLTLYMEILINLNTKIFKGGIQINDRKVIFRHLLRTKFFSDVLPCLFFSTVYFTGAVQKYRFLNFILILRLLRARKLGSQVKEYLIMKNEQAEPLYNLFILLCTIFLWGHIMACLWHYVGVMSKSISPEKTNWLTAKGISEEGWKVRYLYSIYWAVTTMLTVGYGDITPTNDNEMFFNIWSMLLGCAMFGYSMNSIGEILKSAYKKKAYLKELMMKLALMMREKQLPLETQTRIKKYLKFVLKQEQRDDPESELFILNKLSSSLRDEIFLHTNVKILKSVPAFKYFSNKTLILLARYMKKIRLCPEEHVYKEGDIDDQCAYFVLEGTLNLTTDRETQKNKSSIIWKLLKKGDSFGVEELFTGKVRSLGVQTVDFTTLFCLSRADTIQVLKRTPRDYEKFCQIKDLDLLIDDKSQYGIECGSCKFTDHRINECKFFNYQPSKAVIIGRYERRRLKKAKNYKRKPIGTANALTHFDSNSKQQLEFLSVYQEDAELRELMQIYEMDEGRRARLFNLRLEAGSEDAKEVSSPMQKSQYTRKKGTQHTRIARKRGSNFMCSDTKDLDRILANDDKIPGHHLEISSPCHNLTHTNNLEASENGLDKNFGDGQIITFDDYFQEYETREKTAIGFLVRDEIENRSSHILPSGINAVRRGSYQEIPFGVLPVVDSAKDINTVLTHRRRDRPAISRGDLQLNIDSLCIFKNYFPRYNVDRVLKRINRRFLI